MIRKDLDKVVRKGELQKIENYDKAVADKTQTWICHHRLGLTLDGEFAHSMEELDRMGMYYNRPYFELIFLTPKEHRKLHGITMVGQEMSEETRKKLSEANKGKKLSEETKMKISETMKGQKFTEERRKNISEALKGKKKPPCSIEHRKNLSEALKGKHLSEEHKKKISESQKGKKLSEEHIKKNSEGHKGIKLSEETKKKLSGIMRNKTRSDFGKKYLEHFGYSQTENTKQYHKEYKWYRKHNHKCSWEKEE